MTKEGVKKKHSKVLLHCTENRVSAQGGLRDSLVCQGQEKHYVRLPPALRWSDTWWQENTNLFVPRVPEIREDREVGAEACSREGWHRTDACWEIACSICISSSRVSPLNTDRNAKERKHQTPDTPYPCLPKHKPVAADARRLGNQTLLAPAGHWKHMACLLTVGLGSGECIWYFFAADVAWV